MQVSLAAGAMPIAPTEGDPMNRRDTLSALLALGAAAGQLCVRAQPNPSTQSKTLGILTHAPLRLRSAFCCLHCAPR